MLIGGPPSGRPLPWPLDEANPAVRHLALRSPCAWGAAKVLLWHGSPRTSARRGVGAIEVAVELLLGRDPAVADYPMGCGNTRPSGSWFRLGLTNGYVADVLQILEAACAAGYGHDPRLGPAVDVVLSRQDDRRRWTNEYAHAGMMAVDLDRPGRPSRWVTRRACRMLRATA